MRQALTALTVLTCLFVAADSAYAQPVPTVTVSIKNKTDITVIVRSYTVVNGQKRPGSLFQVQKNSVGFDTKVPNGIRFYTILDVNTQKQLLPQDQGVPIQGRDLSLAIVQLRPGVFAIVPDGP